MEKRTTSVDTILMTLGVIFIFLSVVATAMLWPSAEVSRTGLGYFAKGTALGYLFYGLIGGFVLIGFGTMIRLLDEIRGQGDLALVGERQQGQTQRTVQQRDSDVSSDYSWDERDITENADGTFSVHGRTYKSRDSAKAYLDMVMRQ